MTSFTEMLSAQERSVSLFIPFGEKNEQDSGYLDRV